METEIMELQCLDLRDIDYRIYRHLALFTNWHIILNKIPADGKAATVDNPNNIRKHGRFGSKRVAPIQTIRLCEYLHVKAAQLLEHLTMYPTCDSCVYVMTVFNTNVKHITHIDIPKNYNLPSVTS